jgi:hypothetical protein
MGKIKDFFRRVFRVAKRKPTQPPTTITGWTFFYGKPNPVMNADGVSSNWTASPYVEPHYWMRPWSPMQAAQTITLTYKIEALSGTPVIHSTECTSGQNSATLARSALIITNGNDTTYFDRAWYVPGRMPLTIGTHTITAPLGDGSGWTFVSEGAKTNPSQWAAMLANTNKIGLTFNGCSSMGHGVFVLGGSVKVTIVSVAVA